MARPDRTREATLPCVTRMPSESGSGRESPAVSDWRCRGSRPDGRGRAPRRDASLGDSDAIRVRIRA
jgi:hypothetical protein